MKNIIATKIIKPRLRNLLFSLLILSAVFLPYSGSSFSRTSVAKASGSTSMVIRAIFTMGLSGNQKNQGVYLYNPTTAAVTMLNWRLTRKDSSGVEANLVGAVYGTVQSHHTFLIVDAEGYDNTEAKDLQYSDPNNLLKNDNTVLLYSDQGHTLVDKVGYGAAKDFETSPFPANPSPELALIRLPVVYPCGDERNGSQDTNNNSRDFILAAANCAANATGAVGDVVNTPEDGSWDPDHLIDFPNGQVSTEEQALKDQAQTAMHWWANAFSTASINCSTAGHFAMRQGVVHWDLRSIMKKACWITDIKTLNPVTLVFDVTGHDYSLLNELYTTYWPDLATSNLTSGAYDGNKASGLFVGTQAWIGTALVNGLAGPGLVGSDGVTNPSPPTIAALDAVHNAGWGIEADRLLANFETIQGRNGGLAYVPAQGNWLLDDPAIAFFLLSMYIPVGKIPFVGPFILKVTKIPGILILKAANTSFTYVVKVIDNAVAKTLTNKALATAGRADMDMLPVQLIGNRGSQKVSQLFLHRIKGGAWRVLAKDAIANEKSSVFGVADVVCGVGNNQKIYKTLMYAAEDGPMGYHQPMLLDVAVPDLGGVLTVKLAWIFRSTDSLALSQERDIVANIVYQIDRTLNSKYYAEGIPRNLDMMSTIMNNLNIDNDRTSTELLLRGASGQYNYNTILKQINMPLDDVKKSSAVRVQNIFAHEFTHALNDRLILNPSINMGGTYYSRALKYNPMLEGLTEFFSFSTSDYAFGAYKPSVDTTNALIGKIASFYRVANPGTSASQAMEIVKQNVFNSFMKYGDTAFDHIINLPSGPFDSHGLALLLEKKLPVQESINIINIKSINTIPPSVTFPRTTLNP